MRQLPALAAAIALFLFSAVPALAADGDPGKVTIAKHACTEQPIKSQAEFDAVLATAKGDDVAGLADAIQACPTIVLPGNENDRSGGVAGPAVDFALTVTDSKGGKQTLADATFTAAKLCETDLDRDINGDGKKTAEVCLDISNYTFSNLAVGAVTIRETTPPNGWKFGTMLLTPKVLQPTGSDDSKTDAAFTAKTGTVTLDLAGDPDDQAMVHIYLFANSPGTDTLPATPDGSQAPLLAVVAGLFALLGGAYALRRRAA
ncbi:MAG: hypothetical protein M3P18_03135 [Actinomycetota bacterium]|nr:hypothetical protein [Actinomycetota bacterium]